MHTYCYPYSHMVYLVLIIQSQPLNLANGQGVMLQGIMDNLRKIRHKDNQMNDTIPNHHDEQTNQGKDHQEAPSAYSNVFTRFDQSQIQEFKEAFNMIDQNCDGFIDKEDLHDMLASFGKDPNDEYLQAMMNVAPRPINFTMFLTMFGEKLNGTDLEDVIRNAYACFGEEGTGYIQEDYLRDLLTTMGDQFTDGEMDEVFHEAPIDIKAISKILNLLT
ncbi:hypothetical protein chiPu_0002861 [Chiloscyllium punctatum]|uniref:EF-hand domain-containing protein n=1 Tax=Chiloscyllium punctatum TaxID=137246 RepID=A0A401S270_CHIPU|nr:hypothetical protein [Chiloscyllium punctatum]